MINKQRTLQVRPGDTNILGQTTYPGQLNNLQVSEMGTKNFGAFIDPWDTLNQLMSSTGMMQFAVAPTTRYSEGNVDNILTGSVAGAGVRNPNA